MSKGNATYLFRTPSDGHHHSESFWTSLFAIALLLGSRAKDGFEVPAFHFKRCEETKEWLFEQDGSLAIMTPLEWSQVVVEGKLRPGFVPDLAEPLPQDLWDLRPDILIRIGRQITLIEVKTVGHHLGEYQKLCCERIASYLQRNGYSVDLFFLISAGHESRKDWELLLRLTSEAARFRLLLWEKILRVLDTLESTRALASTMPPLREYIEPEAPYMRGFEA